VRTPADGVLLVDKPAGITSTRALAIAKRCLNAAKAGHTGTLDPFATGLLPLVFGEATKFSRFLLDADKTYDATLHLGLTTTTGDTEGPILEKRPVEVDITQIEAVSREFLGFSTQIPPMHSAIRIEGRRLYDLAREGVEVVRVGRGIRLDDLRVLGFSGEMLRISVKCSKGTYIRVLAEDIGRRLGCGAHLVALRRTRIGRFDIGEALALDALLAMGEAAGRSRLMPAEVLVEGLPRVDLDEAATRAICNGQELDAGAGAQPGERGLFGPGGVFLGVGLVAIGRLSAARLMATGTLVQIPDLA
jgi:tRNA pseudouridine55 synthase